MWGGRPRPPFERSYVGTAALGCPIERNSTEFWFTGPRLLSWAFVLLFSQLRHGAYGDCAVPAGLASVFTPSQHLRAGLFLYPPTGWLEIEETSAPDWKVVSIPNEIRRRSNSRHHQRLTIRYDEHLPSNETVHRHGGGRAATIQNWPRTLVLGKRLVHMKDDASI